MLKAISIVALSISVASCNVIEPVKTITFKITIDINTPEGVRSGSSIWGVQARNAWLSGPSGGVTVNSFGEAVVIENRTSPFFALLHGEKPYYIIRAMLASESEANWQDRYSEAFTRWIRNNKEFDLNPDDYPIVVQFRDLKKPSSVKVIDVSENEQGISITRVHIAITNEIPKYKVQKYLPWIEKYDLNFDGEQFHNNKSDANGINRLDFIRRKW